MSDLFTANGSAIEIWHVIGVRYPGRGTWREVQSPFDVLIEARDEAGACKAFGAWLGTRSWEAARVDNVHRCHTTELALADWTRKLIATAKKKQGE